MAGDWIKIELTTPDKPEVFAIAEDLGIDPDAVFGKLFRVWSWFDQQTEDGNAKGVSKVMIDRLAGIVGFSESVAKVGWLRIDGSGVSIPNFDKHNGKTAKKRVEHARRVAKHKAKVAANKVVVTEDVTGASPKHHQNVTGASPKHHQNVSDSSPAHHQNITEVSPAHHQLHHLEKNKNKRIEDIKVVVDTREEQKPDPVETAPSNTQAQVVVNEWNLLGEPFPACMKLTDKRRTALRQRLSDPEWSRTWRQALDRLKAAKFARGENRSGWVADIDFFLRPDSVVKILEGKYDNGESRQQQRTFEHRGSDRRFNSGQVYDPNADTSEIIV